MIDKRVNIIYNNKSCFSPTEKMQHMIMWEERMNKMEKEIVLTYTRLKELEAELEYLKTEKRKEVSEKIKVARGFGDLSENAEYDEAKKEQGEVEVKIANMEKMLKNAKVIDEDEIDTSKVAVGTKVTIYDVDFEEEVVYEIVGSTEASPDKNKISDESPLGRAIIGAKIDETVTVEAPNGEYQVKIIAITK